MIESLIARAAESEASEDYTALFASLREAELFLNLVESAGEGSSLFTTPVFEVAEGFRAVRLFASREPASGVGAYAGITWLDALQMILKMPEADGLVLQSSGAAWVALDKSKAKELLDAALH